MPNERSAEYEAALSDVIVVERTDRRYLRVHGRDPVRMVQGLVTNDIAGADAEQRAVYAALLTPKGKMVADVRVLRRGTELLLETDAAAVNGLAGHLRKFVPPLFARFDLMDDVACTGLYGPRAATILRDCFGADVSHMREDDAMRTQVAGDDVVISATSYAGVPGFDLTIPAAVHDLVLSALASARAQRAGLDTLDVLRIEAGRPRWGYELNETTIPLEAGLRERAISESKGCYTGQEVIIRILHRGHVNWLLRGVLLGDAPPPVTGTALHDAASGKQVGRITSAVHSPAHGGTIALAYVRREAEPPVMVRLGDAAGAEIQVVALPFVR